MTDDWGLGWEEIICGNDTNKGVRFSARKGLTMAAEENGTLRVDIKIRFNGALSSESAHDLKYDPKKTDLETILSDMVQSLNDYPGTQFYAQGGEIRIYFSKLGSTEKYGTWGYTVQPRAAHQNHAFPPPLPPRYDEAPDDRHRPSFSHESPSRGESPSRDEEGEDEPRETDGYGNNPNRYDPRSFPTGLPQIHQPTPIVDQQQARAWLEMMAGLNFRSQAQLLTITERVIRMVEAYTLRFGMPNQDLRSFSGEIHQAPPAAPSPPQDMGILPMLMKMAAGMASAETPTQAVTEAAKVVTGPSGPSNGTARKAAIRGAGGIVSSYRSGRDEPVPPARATRAAHPNPNPPPVEPYDETPYDHSEHSPDEPPPYPGGYPPDDSTGTSFFSGDGELDRIRRGDDHRDAIALRGRDLFSEDSHDHPHDPNDSPDPTPAAPFDPAGLTTEEMKQAVLTWLRADPSRKGEVMAMVPDLMKEL
jgi:hypothetical protein